MSKTRYFSLTLPNGRVVKFRHVDNVLGWGPQVEVYACNGQFLGLRMWCKYEQLLRPLCKVVLAVGSGKAVLTPLGDLLTQHGIEPCGLKEEKRWRN